MDNEEKIKEKVLDREARTPCVFFHYFVKVTQISSFTSSNIQKEEEKVRPS